MAKYKDKIDLYDDRGKLIEKGLPLEAISPLKNPAIMRIGSLAKRTIAVDMPGIEKGLKTGRVGGGYIKGKEIDAPVVKDAEKVAKAVKDILRVSKDDDTEVRVIMEGKRMIIMVPSQRLDAGIEYTTGFTAAAAAMTQAIIDLYDVPIYKANMVKAAVWGRYPQTLNFLGSNLKSILEVPQNNEGAGYALRNIMANHIVALSGKNAMVAAA
ncbi:MAG: methyl-coenzyme M reductase subunit beta, partial [Methanomassiliicoccales archaeon]|nr:methyl-coenzyme M reductase subunit beta [Methanomassiliicoccales archaeon]